MKFNVVNKDLNVGAVKVTYISGSSVFLVGDAHTIQCSSIYEIWEDLKVEQNEQEAASSNRMGGVSIQGKG